MFCEMISSVLVSADYKMERWELQMKIRKWRGYRGKDEKRQQKGGSCIKRGVNNRSRNDCKTGYNDPSCGSPMIDLTYILMTALFIRCSPKSFCVLKKEV